MILSCNNLAFSWLNILSWHSSSFWASHPNLTFITLSSSSGFTSRVDTFSHRLFGLYILIWQLTNLIVFSWLNILTQDSWVDIIYVLLQLYQLLFHKEPFNLIIVLCNDLIVPFGLYIPIWHHHTALQSHCNFSNYRSIRNLSTKWFYLATTSSSSHGLTSWVGIHHLIVSLGFTSQFDTNNLIVSLDFTSWVDIILRP